MKKTPLILILLLFTFSFNYSQNLGVGLKGGINSNNIGDFYSLGGSISTGVPNEIFEASNEISYQFGVYFNFQVKYFFIRPEINYSSYQNKYEFPTNPAKWSAQQVEIPILFGYNIYRPVYLFAGPVFNFITDMSMEGWQETSYADAFTYKSSSTSISVGLLLDFGRVGIDFRYQYGLTTVEEQRLDMIKSTYGVNLGDLKEYNPSQFMVNIQVKLFTFYGDKEKKSGSGWRNHKNL